LTAEIPVRVTAGFPSALIDVRITPRYDGIFDPNFWDPEFVDVGWVYDEQPQISVAIDGSLSSSAFPRTIGVSGARRQILHSWQFLVGSTEIPWYRRLHGTTVSESIDGITQFSFSAPRRGSTADPFAEPLGSPRSWLGIPGGKQPITVTAQFLLEGGGSREVTLVQDGIFDNTSGKVSEGGDTRTWNGGGAHARIDRVPITYQAPPGHGQTSGTVVRRLLTLAGVEPTKIAISGGRRLYKELSFIDAPAIVSANAILQPESKRVYHDDRTDTWRLLDYSGIADKRIEGVITADDVLSALGTLGDDAANDAPTCIVLTSTAQVTRDECGRRLDFKYIDRFEIRQIRGYFSRQESSGVITPNGTPDGWAGQDAALRHTERIVIVKEIDCETVLSEETVVYGWFAPEAVRYFLDVSGAISNYVHGVYFFDQGVVTDDNIKAYQWPTQKWTPITWRRVEYSYDDRGYQNITMDIEGGWQTVEGAYKDRSSSSGSAWNSIDYITSSAYTADLRLVDGHIPPSKVAERWFGPRYVYDVSSGGGRLVRHFTGGPFGVDSVFLVAPTRLSQSVVERDIDDGDGTILSESATISKKFAPQGAGDYLYQFGESVQPSPAFQVFETEEVRYSSTGESSHDKITSKYDHRGELVDADVERNIPSYLPVADQRIDIVPPESAFDDPAEYAHALAASRHENRPLKVEVCAPALETVLIPWTMKGVSVEHAENEDDLTVVGIQMMRELSSIDVQFPLPFNPLIRPGQRWVLHLPILSIHYDLLVETVTHAQDERETWTQVTGRFDVI
jgi:hypothetical protein